VQLVTPDLTVAKRFYGGLFDWRFRHLRLGGEDYAEASLDGQLVAGMMHRAIAADANAGFYQTLFDYEVFDPPADQGARHLMLASDNCARASANTLPADRPNARPHGLNYIHVEDVGASSSHRRSGGGILQAPSLQTQPANGLNHDPETLHQPPGR
jgi:predicted enzyme related to lactoylglutathione lyase